METVSSKITSECLKIRLNKFLELLQKPENRISVQWQEDPMKAFGL